MANNFNSLPNPSLNEKVGSITSQIFESYLDYGLTEAEVELLDDANALFETKISLQLVQESLKLAATEATQTQRAIVLDLVSEMAKKVYANPNVTDEMLLKAGFAPRPTRTLTTPTPPLDLSATVIGATTVKLKWNRNGNIPNTKYSIEHRSENGSWQLLDVVTTSKFEFEVDEPGKAMYFRVRASRGNRQSTWSNESAIWAGEGDSEAEIGLAA